MGVSLDEWHLFTNDILQAGKLTTKEDYAAWVTGITTGTLSSAFLLVFGPWAGFAAGKSVHKKAVVSKVKERLLTDGDMRSVLKRWNQDTFAEKGFQAWLELPNEGNAKIDTGAPKKRERKSKFERRLAKQEKKRFKIVIIPENDRQAFTRSNTVSPVQSPGQTSVVPFVEAPQAEHKSPVELMTGPTDHIMPLVNHQQEISPEGADRKFEYRPVPHDIRPDHDARPLEESVPAEEGTVSPSGEVANGRIPQSEVIPDDEKVDKAKYRFPNGAFEME